MSKGKKQGLKTAGISVLIGIAVFAAVYVLCMILFCSHVSGSELESTTKLVSASLSGALGLTALLWAAVMQMGMRTKRLARERREADIARAATQTGRSAYAASLFDITDNEGNKEFFTLYGSKVKPGEDYGPVYIATRLLALICTFFTIAAGLVLVCMLLSVTR